MTTTTNALADRLRAWANGIYPVEAGVELLIRQGKAVYDGAPWIHDDGDRAWLDVETLLTETGVWSGGEQRIVAIAASLIGETRVNLAEKVTGLDRPSLTSVLAAVAHANGSHQHNDVAFDDDGRPLIVRHGALYGWPPEVDLSAEAHHRESQGPTL